MVGRRASWDEARLHGWMREHLPGVQLGGSTRSHIHDAAVLPGLAGLPTLCCDRCEEGVHFTRGVDPRAIGAKAAGRALSDLAATAATPRGLLLALAAPRDHDEAHLRACIEGLASFGATHGAPLVGGDLTARPGGLSLVVTAFGEAPPDPPGRDRARPGQTVLVTGPVGGSLLGRHLEIEPRIAAGRALHAAGVRAMMDVSDGLAVDLDRLARLSSVAIELERIPVHPDAELRAQATGRPALEHALFDGEDHELIACGEAADLERFLREPSARSSSPIGRVHAPSTQRPPGLHLAVPDLPPEAYDPKDPRAFIHGR
ncbi:MAG: thiamine-phosphate kinase [Planctomycetota bacterium]|nr:thiamine-phosphate kinase [Planctomycetota bacterium]